MNVHSETHGAVLVLEPQGKLDGSNSRELDSVLTAAIADGSNQLLLDFSALEYISSSGLRVIIATAKKLKKMDGGIALCHLNEHIMKVFQMSGFNKILDIEDTRESALVAFF